MADLIIGSSNIISTDSGTPTIQSGVSFPAGMIIKVYNKTLTADNSVYSQSTSYFEPGATLSNDFIYARF